MTHPFDGIDQSQFAWQVENASGGTLAERVLTAVVSSTDFKSRNDVVVAMQQLGLNSSHITKDTDSWYKIYLIAKEYHKYVGWEYKTPDIVEHVKEKFNL